MPLGLDFVNTRQLSQTKGGIHFATLHVVPNSTVQELVIVRYAIDVKLEACLYVLRVVADATPIAEHCRTLQILLIVKHDHATRATGRYQVRSIKACYGHVGLFGECDCVGRVFKENNRFAIDATSQLGPVWLGAFVFYLKNTHL